MRFLFDCGVFKDAKLAGIVLQEDEISAYRLAGVDRALRLLSGPVRRRVAAAIKDRPARTISKTGARFADRGQRRVPTPDWTHFLIRGFTPRSPTSGASWCVSG